MFKNLKINLYDMLFDYYKFWVERSIKKAQHYNDMSNRYAKKATDFYNKELDVFNKKLKVMEES